MNIEPKEISIRDNLNSVYKYKPIWVTRNTNIKEN